MRRWTGFVTLALESRCNNAQAVTMAHHHPHPCSDPQHHVDDASGFVREVERACAERGLRLTPIRTEALRLIAAADRPIKAYDLLDRMKAAHAAAAPPTVYRALEFLLANGFVHKLESINAYIGCHHPCTAQHSVPFLICDRCLHAVELEDAQVVTLLENSALALGFRAQAQTLEVHGLCADCAGRVE